MRKSLFLGLSIIVVIGLIFLSACENNSNSTAIQGTPSEEEFVMMSDVSGVSLDVLKIAMDLSDSVMAMGGVAKPLFKAHRINTEILTFNSLQYEYGNYWHIFVFSAVMISSENGQTDSLIVSGVDSLRFSNGGIFVQYPDEVLTDKLDIRQHVEMEAYGADGNVLMIKDDAGVNITGETYQTDVINLNGTVNDSIAANMDNGQVQLMVCEMDMTSTQTYEDLVLDNTQECPTGGTLGMSAAANISCESDNGNFTMQSSWIASFSFDGTNVSIDVYSNGEHWQSTSLCGENSSI